MPRALTHHLTPLPGDQPGQTRGWQQPTTAQLPAQATGLVLPGDRPADLVAFETSMVDFFVDAAELLGLVPEYSPHLD